MAGPLRLIDGGQPAKPRRGKRLWDGCATCETDVGVRSRVLIHAVASPMQDAKGTITGGRKVMVCAMCLARGKYTPHTA